MIKIRADDPAVGLDDELRDRAAAADKPEMLPVLDGVAHKHRLQKAQRRAVGNDEDPLLAAVKYLAVKGLDPLPDIAVGFSVREWSVVDVETLGLWSLVLPVPVPGLVLSSCEYADQAQK